MPKKEENKFYFLKVIQDEKNPVVFSPVTFTDSNNIKLGQTVIAWGGKNQNAVSTGIISSLGDDSQISSTSTANSVQIKAMNTNINFADSVSGGPLLNLNGEVIGIRVSANISENYNFLPSNILKQEIALYATIQ